MSSVRRSRSARPSAWSRRRNLARTDARGAPHVLIFVQNLPVPLDRRVWQECRALRAAGYEVSVVCIKGPGDPPYEVLEGVHIYKYRPAPPAEGLASYAWEFAYSLARAGVLALRAHRRRPLDAVQACNPPDTYWALGLLAKALGARFVYDQHDLCPEVYQSRFGRTAGPLYRILRGLEWATYRSADRVISTNDSYRSVALGRGRRRPEDVTVVRSGPDLSIMRMGEPVPRAQARPAVPLVLPGRHGSAGRRRPGAAGRRPGRPRARPHRRARHVHGLR